MEIIAIVVDFFLNFIKPQKEKHEIRMEFLKLRNLLLAPLKNSRGLLAFYIDKYYDTDRKDKGFFHISPVMTVRSDYTNDCMNNTLLSCKMSPKQIDFIMGFFQEVNYINSQYNKIYEKSNTLKDEKFNVLRLPDYEPITLELKKSDSMAEYLDSYFATTCMFADKYYQQEKEVFTSILVIIDRITKYKKMDKSALVNEYQTTIDAYNRVKGSGKYLV